MDDNINKLDDKLKIYFEQLIAAILTMDKKNRKNPYRSEKIGEFALALSKAQGQMGPVPKSARNDYSQYNYSTLDDMLSVVRPALSQQEIGIIQGTELYGGDEIIFTELIHSSGQWRRTERNTPKIVGIKGLLAVQEYGLNLTYIKKNQLAAMCGVSGADDLDGLPEKPQKQNNSPPQQKQYPSSKNKQKMRPKKNPPAPPPQVKMWEPTWDEFFTDVIPFIPNLMGDTSGIDKKAQSYNFKNLLPPKDHELYLGEAWDPKKAVALKHWLIEKNKGVM